VIGALTLPSPAAGNAACGASVLNDWFDNGQVDRLYQLPCYGEAIDAIPSDIRDYSDAEEVISRALQAATRGRLARGGADPTPGGTLLNETSRASIAERRAEVVRTAAAGVDPSGASVPPIPLLVLGGLSLVLLVSGGVGYVSRRRDTEERIRSRGPADER
jgi:hypothetical protein